MATQDVRALCVRVGGLAEHLSSFLQRRLNDNVTTLPPGEGALRSVKEKLYAMMDLAHGHPLGGGEWVWREKKG